MRFCRQRCQKASPGYNSPSLDQNVISEDFTSVWAGRQYTINLPLKTGLDYHEDQFILFLAPKTVWIYLHDPEFFIFNSNPVVGPPAERIQLDVKRNESNLYRTIGLTEMKELDVPADPCNDDQSYNFNSCVRISVAKQVRETMESAKASQLQG